MATDSFLCGGVPLYVPSIPNYYGQKNTFKILSLLEVGTAWHISCLRSASSRTKLKLNSQPKYIHVGIVINCLGVARVSVNDRMGSLQTQTYYHPQIIDYHHTQCLWGSNNKTQASIPARGLYEVRHIYRLNADLDIILAKKVFHFLVVNDFSSHISQRGFWHRVYWREIASPRK